MQTIRAADRALCPDFHAHTTASDGALLPAELVHRAAERGVTHLAITDHDSMAGITEARGAADQTGLVIVPGVEVSTLWHGREIHVVGLGLHGHPVLEQGLDYQQQQRWQRARAVAQKLARSGIAGVERLLDAPHERPPGRAHFADWLVEHQFVRDRQQAFKRYLSRQGRAWVRPEWVSLEAAVQWIRLGGGRSVIAHPYAYGMTGAWLRRLCRAFAEAGGDAIEVVTGRTTPTQVRDALGLALRHDLVASLGSDFHAPGTGLEPGLLQPLPDAVVPVWQKAPGLLANGHA